MNNWVFESKQYNFETHLHDAPVNTLGNGLMGCRGFFEEEQNGIAALGGIYMAGVFGKADYTPWTGTGRELVNIPNMFYVKIEINGEGLVLDNISVKDFCSWLDLQNGTLTRSYTYYKNGEALLQLKFFRYLSYENIFTAAQTVSVTPLKENLTVKIHCGINCNITNLNLASTEPHPIQPGRRQYDIIKQTADFSVVKISEPEEISLAISQKTSCDCAKQERGDNAHIYTINNKKGICAEIKKQIALSVSIEDKNDVEVTALKRLSQLDSFETQLQKHKAAMAARWNDTDIKIAGDDEAQLTLRYNLYELMASCPEHNQHYSIGARGLTGEMYEGCIFWDTEIFMLPFFSLTRPSAARSLLAYRYHTLPKAREHAKSNWLSGAMYGWQVNYRGEEQTPAGVGAYYSVHVIADIAFALLDYWYSTGDDDFMLTQGLEIAMETARFWVSRVEKRSDGKYDIMAVRGPNEYDVLVNNNLYTNIMARENMVLCRKLLNLFEKKYAKELAELKTKINFTHSETEVWRDIEDNLILPFDKDNDLWLEDDCWLRRRPLDMKKAKPGGKRIIDTTIPYEALPLYQVTKQTDVLHAMKNLPWYFTEKQIHTAYDYYMPKTAFDSSLSYSMFALMAARLGKGETAESFFERTSNLDIKNVQLNTISGLHFANFGGTWQTVVFGFAGVSIQPECLSISPNLPKKWSALSFKLFYKGVQLEFILTSSTINVNRLSGGNAVTLNICGKSIVIDKNNCSIQAEVK